jgi:metal-responsive CopG/Arc/MetJ family transcriptional regulator
MDTMKRREHNFRGRPMELVSLYIPKDHLEEIDEITNELEEANRSVIIRKAIKDYLERKSLNEKNTQ